MQKLIMRIEKIRKSPTGQKIERRMREFKSLGRKSSDKLFNELCFCILTANYSAEGGIRIQKEIGEGFSVLSQKQLAKKLKNLGYRFPNKRAEYIVESRKCAKSLKNLKTGPEAREWIVKNVKGLGYKEASHFLRNIGYTDVAIIDFHIVDLLSDYKLIKKPKTMTKKNYLKIEKLLRKIAENVNLNLGELDLYLWYLETGKILK
jgi:N-glycosylase/DNA lyase